MIRFQNVSFHYKNTDAFGKTQKTRGVDELTLTVKKGEFVVLAGDSGCGKTTVTRLINGLVGRLSSKCNTPEDLKRRKPMQTFSGALVDEI